MSMAVPFKSDDPSAVERYERHREEISLVMSHFFAGYLRDIYHAFDGDLALVIVLAEIAHHSTALHCTQDGTLKKRPGPAEDGDKEGWTLLACNAFSVAQSTGLPRETVRRKIGRLEERGWVERVSRREVRITPKVGEIFLPDFNLKLMRNLLETSGTISELLAEKGSRARR